jgi:hypothetical protein
MRPRGTIVRPLDTPRLTAATTGVSRKMGDVLNRASAQWEPRLLAALYAAAALEADDAHGAMHDLITQHYAISRADLLAVVQLAAQALGDRREAYRKMLRIRCNRHACTVASGQVVVTASGKPFQAIADQDARVLDPTVLDLGEHAEPELGAFGAVAGPEPENVPLPVDGHPMAT